MCTYTGPVVAEGESQENIASGKSARHVTDNALEAIAANKAIDGDMGTHALAFNYVDSDGSTFWVVDLQEVYSRISITYMGEYPALAGECCSLKGKYKNSCI